MVLGPLIVLPCMNFRVVYIENKSINKMFNSKAESTKAYKVSCKWKWEITLNWMQYYAGPGNLPFGTSISEWGKPAAY